MGNPTVVRKAVCLVGWSVALLGSEEVGWMVEQTDLRPVDLMVDSMVRPTAGSMDDLMVGSLVYWAEWRVVMRAVMRVVEKRVVKSD